MKLPKLFFDTDDYVGHCFELQHFKDFLLLKQIDQESIIIEGAKIIYGDEVFYCTEFGEVAESTKDCCGKINCKKYDPRNGVSGRCKHHRNCYEPSGIKYCLEVENKNLKPKFTISLYEPEGNKDAKN